MLYISHFDILLIFYFKAPKIYLDFWNELKDVELSPCKFNVSHMGYEAGADSEASYETMVFSAHVPLFYGDSTLNNKVIIRKCYKDLLSTIILDPVS